jgi:hypothetical protein
MEKDEIIAHVANDILNGLNIAQIVNITRDFSLQKAGAYYDGLSVEEREELEKRILAAKAEVEANEEEVAETEVVS